MKYKIIVSFNCSKRTVKQSVEDAKLLSLIVNKTRDESKSSIFIISEDSEVDFQITDVDLKAFVTENSINEKSPDPEDIAKLINLNKKQAHRIKELEKTIASIKNVINKSEESVNQKNEHAPETLPAAESDDKNKLQPIAKRKVTNSVSTVKKVNKVKSA